MERSVLVLSHEDVIKSDGTGLDHEWITKFAYYVASIQLPPGTVKAVIRRPDDPVWAKMEFCVNDEGIDILKGRCGTYRTPDEFPDVEKQVSLRSPNNPEGLHKILIRRKIHVQGEWHPVGGWAYWDEMVPLTRWRREQDGTLTEIEPYLDAQRFPRWAEYPISSLTRCAEMDAMRRAWPSVFGDLHRPEELDWMIAEIAPCEAMANEADD